MAPAESRVEVRLALRRRQSRQVNLSPWGARTTCPTWVHGMGVVSGSRPLKIFPAWSDGCTPPLNASRTALRQDAMAKKKKRKKKRGDARQPSPLIVPTKKLILPGPRILRPLTPHELRMRGLGPFFLAPPKERDADPLYAYVMRQASVDIASRIKAKEVWERARHWLFAQHNGGSGFQMATTLRRYVNEFANRMIQYGSHSLPCSFNIVEAFVFFDKTCFFFGLRPEREHLLDVDEYFDWYLLEGLPREPSLLKDTMDEGVVYSYDLTSSSSGYRVRGKDSTFVLAGASFVRHGDELSCILVAGEMPPRESDELAAEMYSKVTFVPEGKETLGLDPSLGVEDRYLEGHPYFARVIVLARFDLVARKYDVRYFALDLGQLFFILTDDPAIWTGVPDDQRWDPGEMLESFQRYDELFSTLASLIYLPVAFVAMAERTHELSFPTELESRASEQEVRDALKVLGTDACVRHRKVRCLTTRYHTTADSETTVSPPELEVRADGFWRRLAPGEIGVDKEGGKIVGRSWVTRHESWSASSPRSFLLTRTLADPEGADPGTVYIVRSPSHQLDLYKIGLTRRGPDVRAGELTRSSGVPLPFAVLAQWCVGDCAAVEKEIHTRLKAKRVNPNREFFHGRLQELIAVTNQVIVDLESAGSP